MLKRCKNCRLWKTYRPDLSGSKPRACVLRLREMKREADGKDVLVPSLDPDDTPGPHFGERTNPQFVCGFFAAKHRPVRSEARAAKIAKQRARIEARKAAKAASA